MLLELAAFSFDWSDSGLLSVGLVGGRFFGSLRLARFLVGDLGVYSVANDRLLLFPGLDPTHVEEGGS